MRTVLRRLGPCHGRRRVLPQPLPLWLPALEMSGPRVPLYCRSEADPTVYEYAGTVAREHCGVWDYSPQSYAPVGGECPPAEPEALIAAVARRRGTTPQRLVHGPRMVMRRGRWHVYSRRHYDPLLVAALRRFTRLSWTEISGLLDCGHHSGPWHALRLLSPEDEALLPGIAAELRRLA